MAYNLNIHTYIHTYTHTYINTYRPGSMASHHSYNLNGILDTAIRSSGAQVIYIYIYIYTYIHTYIYTYIPT